MPNSLLFQPERVQRAWLSKHGKTEFIDFGEDELAKLRSYFRELDTDGSGSIGLEELEQPLISLGLCKTRAEVKQIMDDVDEDKSGQIEFNEFLHIIKNAKNLKNMRNKKTNQSKENLPPISKPPDQTIFKFFKNLTTGNLKSQENPNIPFQLFVSNFRRRRILETVLRSGKEDNLNNSQTREVLSVYRHFLAGQDPP